MVKTKRFTQRILISMSWIRATALLMQLAYILWFVVPSHSFVWVILSVQAALLIIGWLNQKLEMGERVLLLNLLLDLIFLTAYIYFTGGVSNPLISLLLLPVVTGSVALKRLQSLVIMVTSIGLYSLLFLYKPQQAQGSHFSDHLAGMWLVFIASSVLLFYVASSLSQAVRQQEKRIKHYEKRQLRDDFLTALGLSAADAAHQMNTPLATLAVMIDDALKQDELSHKDLLLMQQQINRCQDITLSRQKQFDELKSGQHQVVEIKTITQQILNGFRLLQPETKIELTGGNVEGKVRSNIGLNSALLNLVDNAAKASQQSGEKSLRLNVSIDANYCVLEIIDRGPGIERDILKDYGWRPSEDHDASTSDPASQRMGIGTLISNASIEQVGGHLWVRNNEEGVTVTVQLPLVSG